VNKEFLDIIKREGLLEYLRDNSDIKNILMSGCRTGIFSEALRESLYEENFKYSSRG
jgi:hypothetical protein